jgi:Tfp pilus assembly protein PilO
MNLRDVLAFRWQITIVLALGIVGLWLAASYRPRSREHAAIDAREHVLSQERDQLTAAIAEEQRQMKAFKPPPVRVAPALANQMSPVERLKYFLENITRPANDLDLSYFTVTPLPPISGPNYQELPFSISVAGSYAALADYLYQLEYQRDFVVRDLNMMRSADVVRAEFQLSALLLNQSGAVSPSEVTDPGRPTSLELARDPFTRPPAKLATAPDGKSYFLNVPPGLQLSGIMATDGRMVAIINHEPYRVGDSIDNKKITKITDRGVEMSDRVRSFFLEMERPAVSTAGQEASRR